MKTITNDQLAAVIGGTGGVCTPANPTGAPAPQYLSPSQPAPKESPNLTYADELEHALHGRPPIPRY
jgi:bacteriocin-like protein